jgi:hypothetical protein
LLSISSCLGLSLHLWMKRNEPQQHINCSHRCYSLGTVIPRQAAFQLSWCGSASLTLYTSPPLRWLWVFSPWCITMTLPLVSGPVFSRKSFCGSKRHCRLYSWLYPALYPTSVPWPVLVQGTWLPLRAV